MPLRETIVRSQGSEVGGQTSDLRSPPAVQAIRFGRPLRDVIVGSRPPKAFGETLTSDLRFPTSELAEYERGRREGEKALSEQLLRQRGELIELQNGVLNSLRQAIPDVTRECEGALVALALEIAGKLVAELPISSEMVEAAVREALANTEQNSSLTVLLNPMDYELLQQANAPVLLNDVGGERMKFQTSPQVSRGGCMIQTSFGVVDARRETKLAALKQSLNITPSPPFTPLTRRDNSEAGGLEGGEGHL